MFRNVIVSNEVLCIAIPMHRNVIDGILCRPVIVIHYVYHLFNRNVLYIMYNPIPQ